MKFGIHLSTNLTPEWNSQYIQYEYMKELLEKAVAVAPIISDDKDNLTREQYFVRADEDFFEVRIVIMFHLISIDFF
jgi:SPX domain protein involved in polyphosphate accumulation